METFLKQVAHDLYIKTNGNLGRTAVVFPNKRASLFFNEYLSQESAQPIWSPAYISISDLFRQSSSLQIGDSIKLVCDLYKVFCQVKGSTETLDEFYFWGEMLIADFDDADKNLVDTDVLFSNLKDLKDMIDNYEFLEEGQKEAIEQFFHNFSIEQTTELKRRFTNIWDSLGDIYVQYKELLASQQIAYEGMMYRAVYENLDVQSLPFDQYVFVGFNVLNKVEHHLFKKLQDAGKARFYWDYDKFYLEKNPHEAGEFIRRNLRDFPSELPPDCFDHLNHPKEITFIESATENGQTRYLPQWLRQNLTETEKETAVVLCNESLLQSVLHSLPENVKHTNITMGFPLSQTPAYSLIHTLLTLHISGYKVKDGRYKYSEVAGVLKHPYIQQLSPAAAPLMRMLTRENRFYPQPSELAKDETLELIFGVQTSNLSLCNMLAKTINLIATHYQSNSLSSDSAFDQLYREALFKSFTLLNRFCTLIENKDLDVKPDMLLRLITRILSTSNIPFHGEPAIGLQVMGVLETRNLDFRNLVMLSVNEGQLPKTGSDSSFIPYNLRKAFGMTTIDHKIAVYAYYFYRLLQRTEKATLIYNTVSDGLNSGELSRFMLQLLAEWKYPIVQKSLEAQQAPQTSTDIHIDKTRDIMKRLQNRYDVRVNKDALLSPSALNTYMDCQLKFYYKYVAGLSAPEDVSDDIDSAHFGTIFHYAAEHLYKDLTAHGKVINRETLESLQETEWKLQEYVDKGFRRHFFNIPDSKQPQYNGRQLLNRAVLVQYLQQLLQTDLRYTPFTFVGSETSVTEDIEIPVSTGGTIRSRIGGIIDRMDLKDNCLRIVDYKTGGKAEVAESVESLFTPGEKRSNYIFQTFMYASIVCRQLREKKRTEQVAPALLYIHRAAGEDYTPVIQIKQPGEKRGKAEDVNDFSSYESEFRSHLQELLEEIFNPDLSFTQTENAEKCKNCDFKMMCKR